MRIFLFFILIFNFFSLVARATPPLPDITSYYGQTGTSLQALNFDSLENLQEALLPSRRMDELDAEPIFKRYREYLFRSFSKGFSRAQMILIVRNQLPGIIQSYARTTGDFQSSHYYDFIAGNLAKGDRSDFSDYKIFFEFDTNGKFQTQDIEPNRLAINTGAEIYFNVKDIAAKESFTAADAVQLWLHEILHSDPSMPLEVRDAWGAKVAQFVRERTTEIQMTPERKIIAVTTPDGDYGKMENLGNSPDDDFYRSLKDRFLIFEETPHGAKVLSDVYGGFSTFGNSLSGRYFNNSKTVQLPLVTVEKVRQTGKNTLQIEYRQETMFYRENYRGGYEKEKSGLGYSGVMNRPGDKFRVEWNVENSSVETSRTYSSPLVDGDFEIYRVKDIGAKRFVSLRVKMQDMKPLLNADSLHLLAKDKRNSQLLSFELKQVRVLSKDEVLLHVMLPQKTMEISQILLPESNSENAYSEISLRPSKPLLLQGKDEVVRSPLKFKSMSITAKATDKDKVHLRVELTDTNGVKGLTLDLEHEMRAQSFNAGFSDIEKAEVESYIGLGRKYFLSGSDLKISGGALTIAVPEVDLTKYQMGPVLTQKISAFYTRKWQNKLPYLQDNDSRRVMAVWVHYADGRVEKVPFSQLPTEHFSLISKEADALRWDLARAQAKKRMGHTYNPNSFFDMSLLEPGMTCEELF
jgi:hypothetical protein